MINIFRKEVKFIVHRFMFEKLKEELVHMLKIDNHSGALGYEVKSVYFDTFHNKDLFDVLDGNFIKGKVRLRTYGDNSIYKLELKQKNGDDILKRHIVLTEEEAYEVVKGDYTCLLNKKDSFSKSLYCKLKSEVYRPKLVVNYKREAYIHHINDTRITFDTEVTTDFDVTNFFVDGRHGIRSLDPMLGILEVKYNGFLLDPIKSSLSKVESLQSANSKYANAQLKLSF